MIVNTTIACPIYVDDLQYDPIGNKGNVVNCLNVESVNHKKDCHTHEEAHLGEVGDHGGNDLISMIYRADWKIGVSSEPYIIDEPKDDH